MSHQSAVPVPDPQPGERQNPDNDQIPASHALTDADFDPREAMKKITEQWNLDWRSRQHS